MRSAQQPLNNNAQCACAVTGSKIGYPCQRPVKMDDPMRKLG